MSEAMKIRLLSDTATVPSRATKGSAGYDLSCDKGFILQPNERRLIGTGLAITLPVGSWGEVMSRSGLASKYGIDVKAGTIDQDYIGELMVLLVNNGNRPLRCEAGDRIAQLVVQKYMKPNIMVVPSLDKTDRGDGGFGHSGR